MRYGSTRRREQGYDIVIYPCLLTGKPAIGRRGGEGHQQLVIPSVVLLV